MDTRFLLPPIPERRAIREVAGWTFEGIAFVLGAAPAVVERWETTDERRIDGYGSRRVGAYIRLLDLLRRSRGVVDVP